MSDSPDTNPLDDPDQGLVGGPKPRRQTKDAAEARLAAALKANMARRKAQARARAPGGGSTTKDE